MKKLKLTIITALLLILGSYGHSNAQRQSGGLYISYHDYLNHNLTYAEDTTTTIYFHELFGGATVTVVSRGKKIILDKNELFGYHDSSGNDFRFWEIKPLKIVDSAGFFIYSYNQLLQHGKGAKPTAVFYFSKKANGPIVPLTFYNVSKAFPENTKLRYLLDMALAAHEKPDAFDGDENQYKIKELFLKSLQ